MINGRRFISMVLALVIMLTLIPAGLTMAASGDVINPTPGVTVTIPAGRWFAGIEYTGSAGNQTCAIGSNVTTADTGFTYNTQPDGALLGTKGFEANSAADAKIVAILAAEGERLNNVCDTITLYGVEISPNDNRQLLLATHDDIVGAEAVIDVAADLYTSVIVSFGDGSPDFELTPANSNITQGTTFVKHIYSTAETYSVRVFAPTTGQEIVKNIVITQPVTPVYSLTATPANPISYGATVNVTFTSNVGGPVCLDWDTNNADNSDQYCHTFGANGGTFTVPHVYDLPNGGTVVIGVRDAQLNMVKTLALQFSPKPAPVITLLASPKVMNVGDIMTAQLDSNEAIFGTLKFGDGAEVQVQLDGISSQSFQHVYTPGQADQTKTLTFVNAQNAVVASDTVTVKAQSSTNPVTGTVRIVVKWNQAIGQYGAPVELELCAIGADFDGTMYYGDGQNTGPVNVAKDTCKGITHVFVNQTNGPKTFTLTAIRTGETTAVATAQLTVRQETYTVALPIVMVPFNAPTLQVSTQAPPSAQSDVVFTVNSGSARTMWLDFGNNANSGKITATSDGQSFTFSTRYSGDYDRGEKYPVQLSYLNEKNELIKLPVVEITTNYRR